MDDYYQILEVDRNASIDQIKKSYKRLVRVFHPDQARNDVQKEYFHERMVKINEAYAVLKDAKSREAYDRKITASTGTLATVEVSPSHLSFGNVDIGETATNSFVLHFTGDLDSKPKVEISVAPEKIFSSGEIFSIFSDRTFPIEIEIVANTSGLASGRSYKGKVTVGVNGTEVQVTLLLKTRSARKGKGDIAPLAFRFRSGDAVYSPEELIPLCDQYWDEAKKYVYEEKYFKKWFVDLRRNDMVARLEEATREKNRDIGLEKFLQSINPDLDGPFIAVRTKNAKLTNYNYESWDAPKPTVVIENKGRGCCYGTIKETKGNLFEGKEISFAIPPGKTQEISLRPNRKAFIWETEHRSSVRIKSNSRNFPSKTVKFSITTPRYPVRAEIEKLRDEGKWRLALEKLSELDTQHANAEALRTSIEESRSEIQNNLLIATAIIYAVVGGIVGYFVSGGYDVASAVVIGTILGAALGPGAAMLYFVQSGGEHGKSADYAIGTLFLAIIAVVLGVIIGIIAGVIWLIVNIIIPLLILFFILGGLASGGG